MTRREPVRFSLPLVDVFLLTNREKPKTGGGKVEATFGQIRCILTAVEDFALVLQHQEFFNYVLFRHVPLTQTSPLVLRPFLRCRLEAFSLG